MASHNDKAALAIAETSNLVNELTREMGLEDAPTELDIRVSPTAFDLEDGSRGHARTQTSRFSDKDDYLMGLEERLEKNEARTASIGVALLGIVAGGLLGALLAKQAPTGSGRPRIGGRQ